MIVDCANGIGAPKLQQLANVIGDAIEVETINGLRTNLNLNVNFDFIDKEVWGRSCKDHARSSRRIKHEHR